MLDGPPVYWSDAHGGFWILSRYDDVKDALSDDARFSSASGVTHPTPDGLGALALDQDRPEHTVWRRLYANWLNPRVLREYHPMIEGLTTEYVQRFADSGGGDFVAEVSAKLPVRIIVRTLGIDADDADRLHEATDLAGRLTDGPEIAAAFEALFGLCAEQIQARRAAPREDFLTRALGWEVDGRAVTDDEMVRWLAGAIIAGHETTLMAGAALIHDLARDQRLQEAVRQNPVLMPRLVDESLRFNSPVQRFFRTLAVDVDLHGVRMRAGDRVMLLYAAANIDARRFPNPHRVDLERDFTRHLGFGWGIHRCVGASLAGFELAALGTAMLRAGQWELTHEPEYAAPSAFGNFLGIKSLEVSVVAST